LGLRRNSNFKPKGTIEKFYADYGVEYVW
jgi:hypothetical protein